MPRTFPGSNRQRRRSTLRALEQTLEELSGIVDFVSKGGVKIPKPACLGSRAVDAIDELRRLDEELQELFDRLYKALRFANTGAASSSATGAVQDPGRSFWEKHGWGSVAPWQSVLTALLEEMPLINADSVVVREVKTGTCNARGECARALFADVRRRVRAASRPSFDPRPPTQPRSFTAPPPWNAP